MTVAQSIIDRLVVALDVPTGAEALALARTLSGRAGMFKVGLELFCAEGPAFVREVQKAGPVFLDLKLHDIPNTVHRAMEALLPMNPSLVTIHTQGGPAMIEAAAQAVKAHRQRGGRTQLLGVTVLTSLDREALARLGSTAEPGDLALHLARLAKACGCDGVVCSAHEAASVRDACGAPFHRLTPGIRPGGVATQDQARVVTPAQALREGATWLVVGRPITQAPDPAAAAQGILLEMAGA
ncbi:orotidine-5'-phosphate decarboxylase [Mesoterricola silvestris]|uniref:Orotidine 5'-phosphate decarboxylase n=1 Tax=Mesoterricola silvestris TaxID=2927979 RepID=A0AA48GNA8_9BACT|nr:orotidine-5'-phosphate decarboxylase [Mesoterricola silvestris]BDU74547.1 orotidine 5'-phosphate decarboxylase [Mesoterricola silvestris]